MHASAGWENGRVQSVLISDHEIPERPPLRVDVGEVVEVGDRDTQWPAFVFVTTADGSGWVPARYIDIDGSVGVVRVPYDTTELFASKGERVDIVRDDPESEWSWCRNDEGREGWVPHRVLAAMQSAATVPQVETADCVYATVCGASLGVSKAGR